MLTGLSSLLQILSTSLALLLGWIPLGSVPLDTSPVDRTFLEIVRQSEVLTGADDELDDAGMDPEDLDDAGTDLEDLDDIDFDLEDLDDGILDPEDMEDPVYDFEDLDDAVLDGLILDEETLDDAGALAPGDSTGFTKGAGRTDDGGGAGRMGGGSQGNPSAGGTQDDRDCGDFSSQEDAQRYFDENGGGPQNDVAGLDGNGNGVACEDYDYGQPASRSGSGAGGGGGGGQAGGGSEGENGNSGSGGRNRNTGVEGGEETDPPSGGGNGAATSGGDTSNCRTRAVAGRTVAAAGCGTTDQGVVLPSASGGSTSTDRGTVITGREVEQATVRERSADGGTEIEIDRGGDDNRSEAPPRVEQATGRPETGPPSRTQHASAPEKVGSSDAELLPGTRYDDPVLRWLPELSAASSATGVRVEYLAALTKITSNGDPELVFPDGGVGLLKVPLSELNVGQEASQGFLDPSTNLRLGAEVFARYGGAGDDPAPAIRRYLGEGHCTPGGACLDAYVEAALTFTDFYHDALSNPRKADLKTLSRFDPGPIAPRNLSTIGPPPPLPSSGTERGERPNERHQKQAVEAGERDEQAQDSTSEPSATRTTGARDESSPDRDRSRASRQDSSKNGGGKEDQSRASNPSSDRADQDSAEGEREDDGRVRDETNPTRRGEA